MKKYIVSSLLLLSLIVPGVSFGQEDVDPNPNNLECTSLTSINLRYRSRDIATNGQVSDLQDFLQSKGYLNSEPTGYFGLMTFQAVKSFQSANGISPTGYVGPLTRGKIASQSCGNENTVVYNEFKSEPRPDLRPVAPKTDARGCAPGAVFSSTTGEPCNKNLPVGCSSTSGFSLTTGVPCNSKGIGQPSVNVKVNGLGGAVQVVKGGFVYINWTSENTYSCSATGSSWDDVRSQLSQELTTSGYITVTPQQSAEYTIACRGENKTVSDSVTVKVIANNDTSTCSSSGFDSRTGLRCGCSSTSGFSLTTGEPCGISSEVKTNVALKINGSRGPVSITDGQGISGSWTTSGVGACVSYLTGNYWSGVEAGSGSFTTIYPGHPFYPKTFPATFSIACKKLVGVDPVGDGISDNVIVNNVSNYDMGVFPKGCNSVFGYSSRDGQACNRDLPDGCQAFSGWSSTTGLSCEI